MHDVRDKTFNNMKVLKRIQNRASCYTKGSGNMVTQWSFETRAGSKAKKVPSNLRVEFIRILRTFAAHVHNFLRGRAK